MSDLLTVKAREEVLRELRPKVGATVAAVQRQALELTADAIVAEVEADLLEIVPAVFLLGLRGAYGDAMAVVIYDDLTNRLTESDAEIARRLGTTPQAVSKTLIRVRRNLGFPPRVPNNAHPGPARRAAKKGPSAN